MFLAALTVIWGWIFCPAFYFWVVGLPKSICEKDIDVAFTALISLFGPLLLIPASVIFLVRWGEKLERMGERKDARRIE